MASHGDDNLHVFFLLFFLFVLLGKYEVWLEFG